MKKYFNYLGIIAAAAMTLVSCAKEADNFTAEEPIKDGGEFSIVANPATKTTIDGYQTKWAADDAINLFHAVAGSTDYVDNGKFKIAESDLAAGTFKGTLAGELTSGTYDWYAVYPYTSFLKSVNNAEEARFYIGCRSDQVQTQTGNNSTAHLSGSNYPLFGKASGVAYDETPAITLSPIASFIEVVVTNKNEEPLTVSNVTFTAPDGSEIVGNYIINFNTTPLTITKYNTYVSDEAVLNVSGATALAKDEVARFYLAVKPFATTNGDDIKVSVNGYEKTIHTTKDFTFQAGKIKTVNFDYDAAPDPYSWVKTPIGSLVAGDVIVIVDEDSSTALSSANGSSSAPAASSVAISSNKLSSTPSEALQFVLEVPLAGNYSFKAINTTNYLYTTSSNNGVRVGTNDNKVFVWEDGYLKNKATSRYVGVYNNQDWRCYTSINANIENTQTAFYKKTLVGPSTPQPSVSLLKDSIDDVPAAGVDAKLESDVYTLTDADDTDITVTVDGTIVTDATAADGDVLYSVAANTGAARSGWIKIAVAGGNTVQIDVNQLGASVGTPQTSTVTASKVTSSTVSWTGSADETWSVKVVGGAMGQNVTNSYAQVGTKNNPSTSITFSTSGISGTITSIVVDCASYDGLGTVSATVDGSAFGTQSQSIPKWSSNAGSEVTFSGSASGTISIVMTNGSGGRAMYIKSITVNYTK